MKVDQSLSHRTSKTVAFRVTPEEYDKIQMLADISGKRKQDYLRDRLLEDELIVHPNIRVRNYLEQYLKKLTEELRRLESADDLNAGTAEQIESLLRFIAQL